MSPFDTRITDPSKNKLALLKAARERAAASQNENPAAITKWVNPSEARERVRVVFDDSASMGYRTDEAKKGTVEFNRNCIPNQTAVAIHFLNTFSELDQLNSNLIEVSQRLEALALSSGSTPLFHTMHKALDATPKLTRMVVFTDGEPTDSYTFGGDNYKAADQVIAKAKELSAPIDTVFFGSENEQEAIKLLKYLADGTGGYFLHFDPAKVNFAHAFKYLAGPQRLMLASESVRREIESGKRS